MTRQEMLNKTDVKNTPDKNKNSTLFSRKKDNKLKPCPFCGNKDCLVITYNNACTNFVKKFFIVCENCKITTPKFNSKQSVRDFWNTRYNEIEHKGVVR